ncbi:hypothetical protein GCM10009608_26180 [Pseudonocardia alaniniphila]
MITTWGRAAADNPVAGPQPLIMTSQPPTTTGGANSTVPRPDTLIKDRPPTHPLTLPAPSAADPAP